MNEITNNLKFVLNECACGFITSFADKVVSFKTRHNEMFLLKECSKCKTVYAPFYPDEKSIELYYRENYRKIKHKDESPDVLFERQRKKSTSLRSIYTCSSRDRVIDFGGACGGVVYEFISAVESVAVYDLDKNFTSYANAKGLIAISDIEGILKFKPNIVVMSHVIEHLVRPGDTLEQFKKMGIHEIYISTTFIEDSLWINNELSFEKFIHLAHKYYFNRFTLNKLLNKHSYFARAYKKDWVHYQLKSDGENLTLPIRSIILNMISPRLILKFKFGVPNLIRKILKRYV